MNYLASNKMNYVKFSKYDLNNLTFLLNASTEQMDEWHREAGPEDIVYANELLDRYHTELTMNRLDIIDMEVKYGSDLPNIDFIIDRAKV